MTRIVFVSDLHVDSSVANREFVPALRDAVLAASPDVFMMGGDIAGNLEDFNWTLRQFANLPALKVMVPGNHDIWIESKRALLTGLDSGGKYNVHLPKIAEANGFVMLHDRPVAVGEIAIAGCMGWYDYSYRNADLDTTATLTDYARGVWTNPRTRQTHMWNDMQNVWWLKDLHEPAQGLSRAGLCRSDAEITASMATALRAQLAEAVEGGAERMIVVTHFVPSRQLLVYGGTPQDYWNAYHGATTIEAAITGCALVTHAFFGHLHHDTDIKNGKIRYISRPVGYIDSGPITAADRLHVLDV